MGRDLIDREEVIKAIDELLPEDTLSKEYEEDFCSFAERRSDED